MKRALIISYWFPPDNLPGSYRAGKFVKYLNEFGWKPTVLTARKSDASSRPFDTTLLGDMPPDTDIIRTRSIEPLRLIARLTKIGYKQPGLNDKTGRPTQQLAGLSGPAEKIAKKIYKTTIEKLFSIPDPYIGWVPSAVLKARQIIDKQAPTVMFTSSPPLSTHLVGFRLKKMFGIPWIADFRDVWPAFFLQRKTIFDRINDRTALSILRTADKVVAVSEPMRQEFISRDPAASIGKYELIYNGFDPDDYKTIDPTDFDRFTILYTGEVFQRDPSSVLNATKELVKDGLIGRDFQIIFLGTINRDFVSNRELVGDFVKICDPVPHSQALSSMLGANLLLLLVGESKDHSITIPAKLFEYMFANKPILAISPDGPVSDLIKKAGLGFSYEYNQKDLIKERILKLYLQWKKRTLQNDRDEEVVRGFNRRFLTQRLVDIFEEFVA